MTVPSFNIFREPFTTWRTSEGEPVSLGLQDLFRRSGNLAFTCDDGASSQISVVRFLLALMHRTRPSIEPEDWKTLWEKKEFPEDWLEEIEAFSGEFDLFHSEHPFLQDAELATEKKLNGKPLEKSAPTYLLITLPRGTEINHFRQVSDKDAKLCHACCALGLLELSAVCSMGGQGLYPSINDSHPTYAMPVGNNLFETLLLNFPLEVQDSELSFYEAVTWRPRRVLLPPVTQKGVCTNCGSDSEVVDEIFFLKREKGTKRWKDPHLLHVPKKDKPLSMGRPNTGLEEVQRYKWEVLGGLLQGWNRSVERASTLLGNVSVYCVALVGNDSKRAGLSEFSLVVPSEKSYRETLLKELSWARKHMDSSEKERVLQEKFLELTQHLEVERWQSEALELLHPPKPAPPDSTRTFGSGFLESLDQLGWSERKALMDSALYPWKSNAEAHTAFTSCFWKSRDSIPRDIARHIAFLYFWNPSKNGQGSLLDALRRTSRRVPNPEGIELLIRQLQTIPFSLIWGPLLQAVRILASNNEPIDWPRLISDMVRRRNLQTWI